MSEFEDICLSDEDLAFTNKVISSDSLAAQVITRIKKRIPTSVIRMSDGEKAIINCGLEKPKTSFLQNTEWLNRYGLSSANLKQLGIDLLQAGNDADYLACTISGVFLDDFRLHPFFPNRKQFIDQFYPRLWNATGRVGPVLQSGSVLVLHRDSDKIANRLREKYQLSNITGIDLFGWHQHKGLIQALQSHAAQTVLISGGASGKVFCVALARQTGKVVLDVGSEMELWIS